MSIARRHASLIVVTLVAWMLPARLTFAQSPEDGGRVTVTVLGGVDAVYRGQVTEALQTSGRFGTVTQSALTLNDVQGTPIRVGADVGYRLLPTIDGVVRVAFTAAPSAGPVLLGSTAVLDTGEHFNRTATLSGYRGFTVQGGLRGRFVRHGAVEAYAAVLGGITITQSQTVEVDNGTTISRLAFYSRSFPVTVTGAMGVAVGVSPRLSVGVESGLQFQAPPSVDAAAAQVVLGSPADYAFWRWSVPLNASLRYRF